MLDLIHGLLKANTIVQAMLLLVAIAGVLLTYWPDDRTDRRIGYAMLSAGTSLFLGKYFWPIPDSFGGAAQVLWYVVFQVPLVGSIIFIAIAGAQTVHKNRAQR
jgi:hypothetical protein